MHWGRLAGGIWNPYLRWSSCFLHVAPVHAASLPIWQGLTVTCHMSHVTSVTVNLRAYRGSIGEREQQATIGIERHLNTVGPQDASS